MSWTCPKFILRSKLDRENEYKLTHQFVQVCASSTRENEHKFLCRVVNEWSQTCSKFRLCSKFKSRNINYTWSSLNHTKKFCSKIVYLEEELNSRSTCENEYKFPHQFVLNRENEHKFLNNLCWINENGYEPVHKFSFGITLKLVSWVCYLCLSQIWKIIYR